MKQRLVKLKAKGLILTPMTDEELEAFTAEQTDGHFKTACSEMLSGSRADSENRLWHTCWKIALKDAPDERIGGICFMGRPNERREVTVGCGIDEAFRGRGYATIALNRITDWAFSHENVYFIRAAAEPNNAASLRVLEKCGFKQIESGENELLFEKERPASAWTAIYMCIGISVGTSLGLSLNNYALYMCLGIALGLAVGATLDAQDRKKRKRN